MSFVNFEKFIAIIALHIATSTIFLSSPFETLPQYMMEFITLHPINYFHIFLFCLNQYAAGWVMSSVLPSNLLILSSGVSDLLFNPSTDVVI